MKSKNDECDPNQLESLLIGDLNQAEESQIAEHLERCTFCCKLLEHQAADPSSWQEASQLLKPIGLDGLLCKGGKTEEGVKLDCQPLQIQGVLNALNPTDHPEMLGRLGSYEISGVVGTGAMGVVLKGTDPTLDRTVAIKVMASHLASSGAARKRFAREAKAAAAVIHPNVISIHSVSNDQVLPYLVMPYIRGASLQQRLDQEGSLQTSEILRIGSQIASGLGAAHSQGLVHRDIKPANILLEEGVERVTITDFGLARAADDASLTRTGVIAGTPQYMSPEQSRGEPLDLRSDLFSLGSVIYAMCVGRPPFRADTTYGVIQSINNDQPRDIRELNANIPSWLIAITMKLMLKQSEERFDSAEQVSELLEACLAHVQHPTTIALPSNRIPKALDRSSFSLLQSRFTVATIALLCVGAMAMCSTFIQPKYSNKIISYTFDEVDVDPTKPGQLLLHYCTADGTPIRPFLSDTELRHKLNRQGAPSVSADGSKVAFDAWPATPEARWQDGQIVVADIDGKNSRVICDGFMPSFSPDGSQLAISRLIDEGKDNEVESQSVWIINVNGGEKQLIAGQGAWGARWSGDGKSLLFFKGVNSKGDIVDRNCLRLYNLKTKKITNVFEPEDSPFSLLRYHFEWAPAGRRVVAFAGDLKESGQRVTATIDVDKGLESLQLYADKRASNGISFSWHPNDKLLLVTGNIAGRFLPVHVALTKNAITPGFPGLPDNVGVLDSEYTPDGKHIIMSFMVQHGKKENSYTLDPYKNQESINGIPDWATRVATKLCTLEEVEAKLFDHIHLGPHDPFTRALKLREEQLSKPSLNLTR